MVRRSRPGNIRIGAKAPPFERQPTAEQLLRWTVVSGDDNPVHGDCAFAVSMGLPGVIVPGQLLLAFLGQMVVEWLGDWGWLTKLTVSYKGMNLLGERLICCGVVKEALGERITLEVWVENLRSEKTVVGMAVVTAFS